MNEWMNKVTTGRFPSNQNLIRGALFQPSLSPCLFCTGGSTPRWTLGGTIGAFLSGGASNASRRWSWCSCSGRKGSDILNQADHTHKLCILSQEFCTLSPVQCWIYMYETNKITVNAFNKLLPHNAWWGLRFCCLAKAVTCACGSEAGKRVRILYEMWAQVHDGENTFPVPCRGHWITTG